MNEITTLRAERDALARRCVALRNALSGAVSWEERAQRAKPAPWVASAIVALKAGGR